jgi:chemotaxis protein methyltransferase CheR
MAQKTGSPVAAAIAGASGARPGPELIQLRELIYQTTGIFQPNLKLHLLADACSSRMQALDLPTLGRYYEFLTAPTSGHAELSALLNRITVGETCFFRNQPQLDALCNVVLPRIVRARQPMPKRHLRIWSAGCSTGEEPYTLSLLLLEELTGRLQGWTFEIFATDINENSIAHAVQGVYGCQTTQNLSSDFRDRYFTTNEDRLQINGDLKACVQFSRLNLLDEASVAQLKDLDLILCCNVLIYFGGTSKRRVVQHFYENLLPHGYLFLGHSESLYGVSKDFQLVHLPSAIAYVKSENKSLMAPMEL